MSAPTPPRNGEKVELLVEHDTASQGSGGEGHDNAPTSAAWGGEPDNQFSIAWMQWRLRKFFNVRQNSSFPVWFKENTIKINISFFQVALMLVYGFLIFNAGLVLFHASLAAPILFFTLMALDLTLLFQNIKMYADKKNTDRGDFIVLITDILRVSLVVVAVMGAYFAPAIFLVATPITAIMFVVALAMLVARFSYLAYKVKKYDKAGMYENAITAFLSFLGLLAVTFVFLFPLNAVVIGVFAGLGVLACALQVIHAWDRDVFLPKSIEFSYQLVGRDGDMPPGLVYEPLDSQNPGPDGFLTLNLSGDANSPVAPVIPEQPTTPATESTVSLTDLLANPNTKNLVAARQLLIAAAKEVISNFDEATVPEIKSDAEPALQKAALLLAVSAIHSALPEPVRSGTLRKDNARMFTERPAIEKLIKDRETLVGLLSEVRNFAEDKAPSVEP